MFYKVVSLAGYDVDMKSVINEIPTGKGWSGGVPITVDLSGEFPVFICSNQVRIELDGWKYEANGRSLMYAGDFLHSKVVLPSELVGSGSSKSVGKGEVVFYDDNERVMRRYAVALVPVNDIEQSWNEASCHSDCEHENVLFLSGITVDMPGGGSRPYMVMQLGLGDLTKPEVMGIVKKDLERHFLGLLGGMSKIHSQELVLDELGDDDVLLMRGRDGYRVVYTDFEHAVRYDGGSTRLCDYVCDMKSLCRIFEGLLDGVEGDLLYFVTKYKELLDCLEKDKSENKVEGLFRHLYGFVKGLAPDYQESVARVHLDSWRKALVESLGFK
jgi:hypothetical protein